MSVDVSGTPSTDLVGDLDQQVRAVVRREGVDPQHDVPRVRHIAEQVVRAHDERSLTGVVAPVADPTGVVGELVARVAGFGPLQRFLDDPEVEEVWINDPSRVFIARNGRHELTNVILTRGEVQELVERMLKTSGRRIDLSQPFVDAMLPQGHRLHVVLEGISRDFAAVNIRKFVLKAARLADLVRLGSMPAAAARFLEAAVLAGQNIVVAGGTQTGKTTLLNCLAAAIPGRPAFRASSRSRHSAALTSPTTIRVGRIRSVSRTRSRSVTWPSPARASRWVVRPSRRRGRAGWRGRKNAEQTSSSPIPTPSPTSAPINGPR